MSAILQKLLLEDDFLIEILKADDLTFVIQYGDLSHDGIANIVKTKEKIVNFFGGKEIFDQKIQNDIDFTEQVIEYSKERFTYLLASERSVKGHEVVWVLG